MAPRITNVELIWQHYSASANANCSAVFAAIKYPMTTAVVRLQCRRVVMLRQPEAAISPLLRNGCADRA